MMSKSISIFDCDSHVVEPPEVWDEYVPQKIRSWVKTQFYFTTDSDQMIVNNRIIPASRERSVAAEVGWPGWNKKLLGSLVPGTKEFQKQKLGRLAGCRDPHARLKDMDAIGVDQVMLFATWFVRLALVKDPKAAHVLSEAYNRWVYDYCDAERSRLFPCAVLPIQSVELSIKELKRVAKLGFRAAAVRPCMWNGRYPTMAEFDPLWREFERLGMVLAMHTFPSREPLSAEWGKRMAESMSGGGQALMFGDDAVIYSPGQFISNIVYAMEPSIDSSESLGFIFEAMTWLTTVLMTGWLEKFPKLRCAVLESNATWLPLVLSRSKNFLDLYAYLRKPKVKDPFESFYRQCYIAFEGDEEPVYRMWDLYENVGLWSSDYPHHDAEDAWEALEKMEKYRVPKRARGKLMGGNARKLYGIEPRLTVRRQMKNYEPALLPW